MATAHGIYLKADVDTGKFPLYFLKIFRPGPYGIQRRFRRAFQGRFPGAVHPLPRSRLTDSGPQNRLVRRVEQNPAFDRSQQVLLYAAPVVRQGVDVVCEDYGEIIEIPLTIPARDELGAGQAAVTLGEPQVAGKELEIALTKQDGVVSYYAGYATKSDVEAAGTPGTIRPGRMDAKTYDYDITADFQAPGKQTGFRRAANITSSRSHTMPKASWVPCNTRSSTRKPQAPTTIRRSRSILP